MGLLDWFRGTTGKPGTPIGIQLERPWRREALGAIYCSDSCYAKAGQGMLMSRGKSKPCCFCQTMVTYGSPGVTYMPFLTEPNLVCTNCSAKAQQWNARQKECSLCGKTYASMASAPTSDAALTRCSTCSKDISGWHYSFESIALAPRLGSQCPGCGTVRCKEHDVERCSCGKKTIDLMEGSAQSSMVGDAKQQGKYGQHIKPPTALNRVVVQD
jgi:hypothetical protein